MYKVTGKMLPGMTANNIVDTPITDEQRNVIGHIKEIDPNNDQCWLGVIYNDAFAGFKNDLVSVSIEVVKE